MTRQEPNLETIDFENLEIKDQYTDENGRIDLGQLEDDLSLYLDDYARGGSEKALVMGMVEEIMARLYKP